MEIVGDRKFVEIPGSVTHELPPLLVRMAAGVKRLDKVMNMAADLVDQEDMIPLAGVEPSDADLKRAQLDLERRKMDLALNLVEQYLGFVQQWQWGDGILEWIRQCETTFGVRLELRNLLAQTYGHTLAARVSSCCSKIKRSRQAAWSWKRPWGCASRSVNLRP